MINTSLINNLLEQNITPVFAPITHDQQGQLLNTNADTIAQEIAVSLGNDHEVTLVYLFEKSGVLLDSNDDTTVIPLINAKTYKELKDSNTIFAGMIPKLDNAFNALQKGVNKVIIGKAEDITAVVKGKSGTSIVNE
jgi:acetylglutamate kinase